MSTTPAPSIPRRDEEPLAAVAVQRIYIPVDVPVAFGDATQYAERLARGAALHLALLATGLSDEEITRRVHGWQARRPVQGDGDWPPRGTELQ